MKGLLNEKYSSSYGKRSLVPHFLLETIIRNHSEKIKKNDLHQIKSVLLNTLTRAQFEIGTLHILHLYLNNYNSAPS